MHGMLGLIAGLVLLVIMAVESLSAAPPTAEAEATSDLVWRNGSMTLRLTDRPCGFQALADDLNENGVPPAKALVIMQEGRPRVPGCWALDMDGDVLLRDVSGQDGFAPMSWFKREPQV